MPTFSQKNQETAQPRFRLFKGRRFFILLGLAFIALSIYGFFEVFSESFSGKEKSLSAKNIAAKKRRGAAADALLPVGVSTARRADMPIYLSGLGSVSPETVTVQSLVSGLLTKIYFKEGQQVKAGFILAELDPAPFKATVIQAEGQLARDQALLAEARVDLKRYHTLWQQDSIAKQQLDKQAALVKQYEAAIKLDQGNLESMRLQLRYSKITAPTTGLLGLRQVDIGNNITANTTTLVVIAKIQPILVIFSLPQDHIPALLRQIHQGVQMPVEAWNRDRSQKLAEGRLLAVDNQVDPMTGTVRLRGEFANKDFALYPSQFVNIHLLLDTQRDAVVIPTAAIQRGPQGQFVYVVKADHTVSLRQVKVGPADGTRSVIKASIAAGEVVVVDGLDKLREGVKVIPVQRLV